jgi:hypothetical protein
MGLSHEDVQEIVQLLDDLRATELHVRTRHFTLSLRREGDGWSQSTATAADPPSPVEPVSRVADGSCQSQPERRNSRYRATAVTSMTARTTG